ncbi:MAG: response regulator transcription factor [Herpetosiphonaceae bacterium]|nr:response regulator transcription factor [Herpetosiphonaceae bacterium]
MRLLLIDGFTFIRQPLAFLLAQQPDLEVIGDVDSAVEALRLATQHDVDLVIIEIELPEDDGVDLIRALRVSHRKLAILVLTGTTDFYRHASAIDAGAATVLHRSLSYDELLKTIRATRRHQVVAPA